MNKVFEGIYSQNDKFFTKNLTIGKRVYGEKLVIEKGIEYRQWDAFRSKYAAALSNGLKENIFFAGANVLYLGSAEGTTVSHVSDIVGERGLVVGIDVSEIAMLKLTELAEQRENILPILADAEKQNEYAETIKDAFGTHGADALFQDISQRNQAEIFTKNAHFLKTGRSGAIAIKTKSISQSKEKQEVLAQEKRVLEKEFEILQTISLEPFEKHHYLVLVKKR